MTKDQQTAMARIISDMIKANSIIEEADLWETNKYYEEKEYGEQERIQQEEIGGTGLSPRFKPE